MAKKKSVCVDLDGVLARYDEWKGIHHIGDPIPGAQNFVAKLAEKYNVVIHTTRCNSEVNRADVNELVLIVHKWLEKHGFDYHSVHCGPGKPIAVAYIDDRAVTCKPQKLSVPEQAYALALEAVETL